jgi:RimJ/RimL family protein N-acetyltransferase
MVPISDEDTRTPAFLTGERVVLRPLSLTDADGPYPGWFNDPVVCRYNSHHVYPYTREQAIEYIRSVAGGPDLVLAIDDRETGAHVGNVSLQEIDQRSRTAEFAIVIGDREAWGKGVGAEAGWLILDHGFRELNLRRVAAGTSAANTGMRRLAQRLGMREEGTRRQAMYKDGEYHDIVEFGVLRDEFQEVPRP